MMKNHDEPVKVNHNPSLYNTSSVPYRTLSMKAQDQAKLMCY